MSDAAFKGEDESAGAASPALDLIAAAFLFCLGALFGALSLMLRVPGQSVGAPGLLPVLAAARLCVMAGRLGLSAWRRRNDPAEASTAGGGEAVRRLTLVGAVGAYIIALDSLELERFVPVLGVQIPVGGFEPVTVLFIAVLLRLSWTDRPAAIVAVSVGWTLCLSLAFRGLFGIPLPG